MYGYEIYPLMGDEIPKQDLSYAGPQKFNLRPCKVCGCPVMPSYMEVHIDWHNHLGEVSNRNE